MRTPAPLVASLLAALSTLLACASGDEQTDKPTTPQPPAPIVNADVPGLPSAHLVGDVIICGQPSAEGLVNARDSGISVVINTKPQSEMTFPERSVVQGLGMRYVDLAFTSATLDDVLVENFIYEVKNRKPEDGRLLLHCQANNRAAALWAMYEIKELKVDPGLAVDRARQLGLKDDELVIYIGEFSRRIGAL